MNRIAGLAGLCLLAAAVARGGVGAWTTSGPAGGALFVAVDPETPGLVYTESARSTDGGATWSANGLTFLIAHVLGVGAPKTLYVGGYGTDGVERLFASHDGASSWDAVYTATSTDFSAIYLTNLAVDSVSPATLYMSVSQTWLMPTVYALERSLDGGHTWSVLNVPRQNSRVGFTSIAVDPKASGTLYVSVAGYFCCDATYRSTDGGTSWSALPTSGNDMLAVDPQHPLTLYVANRNGEGTLMKSLDGGSTVTSTGAHLGEVRQLLVSPANSSRVIALVPSNVLESDDGGATFLSIGHGLPDANSIAFDPTGTILYAATASGVYSYQADPGVLRLNAAHPFTVTLTATDQRTGRTGAGVASQVNDLWGYFSLPAITGNPSNPEVFVKMLDGTAINGMYWFFYGGLTDLEYTLTVREDATGLTRTYTKPAGSECGGSDTAAFGP